MDLQHMENGMGGGGGGGGVAAGGGNNAVGLSETEFQRFAQIIATSIQKIQQNISTMQRMVNQFNTPQDSPELKKQLHQIMTYTNQLVSDTNNQLKDLDRCKERHLKIQRDRLVDEFTGALTSFQALQRKTVDIEKSAVRQARANSYNIAKPPGSNSGNNSGSNSGSNNGSFFEDNFFNRKSNQQQQQQMQTQLQEEINLQALEEQESAIRELEENIVGVNEIYKKLGAMVYEQGLTVNSIESSVEQTSVFVSQGTQNLRQASSYKNKLRKKKLILVGVLSAVLLVITIILVVQFKN